MTPGGPNLVLASGSSTRRALLEAAGLRFTVAAAAVDEAAVKRRFREGAAGPSPRPSPGGRGGALAPFSPPAPPLPPGEGRGEGPAAAALALADAKAATWTGPGLVIGADQILECEGRWFDKPPDLAGAAGQLRALRGRTHQLHTAAVCWQGGRRVWAHVAAPTLTMRPFSDAFLDAYLAAEGDAVLGSVGAYRLEGLGMHLFNRVEGEHAAVLGLPMLPLLTFLRAAGAVLA